MAYHCGNGGVLPGFLRLYCQAYARWREAEEYIAEHGTTDGNNRTLPQVAVAQTYLGIMSEFAGQLGLTPAGGASGG